MSVSSIYEVIDYIDATAKTTEERGSMWERVTAFFLRSDPEQDQVMGKVSLWADAPTNTGHDVGIDLVAEDELVADDGSGRYWAIQCKAYVPTETLTYDDCSTFWAKGVPDPAYARYMLSTTTEHLSKNLLDQCKFTGTVIITPSVMAESNVDWSAALVDSRSARRETYDLREHQRDAVRLIGASLETHDRCKAIMACGTGKTLMSLRLAEGRCPTGLVLFCAPSIALVGQAMREWTNQARTDLRTLVVCSDAKASRSRDSDDVLDTTADLAYPSTTDPATLVRRYREVREASPDAMVAVFATYQSMQVVQDAQQASLPDFDLIICDEAHRTTGYRDPSMSEADVSAFQIVHDQGRVRGGRRLYMTATPRIYGDTAKRKARQDDYALCSMDDEAVFGPTAYEISFADAVERGLLCDYRVIVLSISEDAVPGYMQQVISDGSELKMDDAAKIIGCYKGLLTHGANAERRLAAEEGGERQSTPDFFLIDAVTEDKDTTTEAGDGPSEGVRPLHRAVGFCARIADSKRIDKYFERVVERYEPDAGLSCRLDHVDGTMDSNLRADRLRWLSTGSDPSECRILTNARCLAEGVDVPSLDAVIFFAPRKSEIDIVQAVGRVMRTFHRGEADEKRLGYIILPVFVPSGMTPEQSLDNSRTFDVVWKVLQALRSHDERIEAYVNSLPFRRQKATGAGAGGASAIGRPGPEEGSRGGAGTQMVMDLAEQIEHAIYTKMVERCGTRIYWDSWADDVARIAERHVTQIRKALDAQPEAREAFGRFLEGLRDSLNPGITEDEAIEMVAQHMITLPVFDALFQDFEFKDSNPVSIAINEFLAAIGAYGVGEMADADRRSLDDLYASVRRRAQVVSTDFGRQELIKDLYENFFSKAFKSTSDKLGIVYTPGEVIDYILHSTDRVLRREFGHGLADEGVHVLDPFAGTGSFMARLIEDPSLIPADKLRNKYLHELHSNEILLLAYYIMVVNTEYAYHSRVGGSYERFPGAVLTDTFQMGEDGDRLDVEMFVDNSERVLEQEDLDIEVIVGNPPYSAGQKNANDNNANESYPSLDKEIATTYLAESTARSSAKVYDSYIRAFRWASDRIGQSGVVCFVSGAGWLSGVAMDGFRKSLAQEFNSVYILNLRGHKEFRRLTKKQLADEGDNIFGSASTTPIAITMLVRSSLNNERGAIYYHDIGIGLGRKEKLSIVERMAVAGVNEWTRIRPDRHGDWLDQRDDSFSELAPVGLAKYKQPAGLFETYSLGFATGRDAWSYSFGQHSVVANIGRLLAHYNSERERYRSSGMTCDPAKFVDTDSTKAKWNRTLFQRCARNEAIQPDGRRAVMSLYRPFCKEWLYYDERLIEMTYQQPRLFPLVEDERAKGPTSNPIPLSKSALTTHREVEGKGGEMTYQQRPLHCLSNVTIMVPGKSNSGFNCLITNNVPDLNAMNAGAQSLPLYWYEKKHDDSLFASASDSGYTRHDAITDEALDVFRAAYPTAFHDRPKKDGGASISKEDVFYYVYGVLHSPEYRERFIANLAKELPRIPLAKEFETFSKAGRALAALHLGYESVEVWPNLDMGISPDTDPGPVRKMSWVRRRDPETGKKVADHTRLVYNEKVTVSNIPESAQGYVVNGKSPLDWMIDRYQVTTDGKTGITNDPNEYSDDPRYILDLIGRLVTVSMRTNEIVAGLPAIDEVEHPLNWPVAWKAAMK